MMMSKPKPEATSSTTPSTTIPTTTNPAADAVADLERRLADLSAATPIIPQQLAASSTTTTSSVQSTTTTAPIMSQTAPSTSAASNKNALLARIIAAQERAKLAQPAAPPAQSIPTPATSLAPPSFDLLSMPTTTTTTNDQMLPTQYTAPPSFDSMMSDMPSYPSGLTQNAIPPPPAFDDTFFSPPTFEKQQQTPPPFDPSFLPPPSYSVQNTNNGSHDFMQFTNTMHASAPAFEDLMPEPNHHPAPLLPPPVPPPSSTAESGELDDEAIQAILGIEGLSHAEKQELINEQRKIMKSIEDSKKSAQVSAADAFEQRSFSSAVKAVGGGSGARSNKSTTSVMGMERTQQAIADGTAVVVQCSNCAAWMQVTGAAQFMMCSSCNTMTQVQAAGMSSEEAQQMMADMKLAEQLQKEEYEEADRAAAPRSGTASSASPSRNTASSQVKSEAKSSSSSGSWMEWLGFGTPAQAPASRVSNDLQLSYSRDSADDAADGLLGSPSSERRQGARVATQQPLFACVTDSINSAANYAINGMHEDAEGNVHGVDSSSLLAVPQVGRGSSNQSYEQMPRNDNQN